MKTHTITTYDFNELSPEAQQNALDLERDRRQDWHVPWSDINRSMKEAQCQGLSHLRRLDPDDFPLTGYCADRDFIKLAKKFQLSHGRSWSRACQDLADDLMQAEQDYMFSDVGVKEHGDFIDAEFLADGRRYEP